MASEMENQINGNVDLVPRTKMLTRNRFSQWNHLVAINLDSMFPKSRHNETLFGHENSADIPEDSLSYDNVLLTVPAPSAPDKGKNDLLCQEPSLNCYHYGGGDVPAVNLAAAHSLLNCEICETSESTRTVSKDDDCIYKLDKATHAGRATKICYAKSPSTLGYHISTLSPSKSASHSHMRLSRSRQVRPRRAVSLGGRQCNKARKGRSSDFSFTAVEAKSYRAEDQTLTREHRRTGRGNVASKCSTKNQGEAQLSLKELAARDFDTSKKQVDPAHCTNQNTPNYSDSEHCMQLSRNPHSEWRRLIDSNMETLGDQRRRSQFMCGLSRGPDDFKVDPSHSDSGSIGHTDVHHRGDTEPKQREQQEEIMSSKTGQVHGFFDAATNNIVHRSVVSRDVTRTGFEADNEHNVMNKKRNEIYCCANVDGVSVQDTEISPGTSFVHDSEFEREPVRESAHINDVPVCHELACDYSQDKENSVQCLEEQPVHTREHMEYGETERDGVQNDFRYSIGGSITYFHQHSNSPMIGDSKQHKHLNKTEIRMCTHTDEYSGTEHTALNLGLERSTEFKDDEIWQIEGLEQSLNIFDDTFSEHSSTAKITIAVDENDILSSECFVSGTISRSDDEEKNVESQCTERELENPPTKSVSDVRTLVNFAQQSFTNNLYDEESMKADLASIDSDSGFCTSSSDDLQYERKRSIYDISDHDTNKLTQTSDSDEKLTPGERPTGNSSIINLLKHTEIMYMLPENAPSSQDQPCSAMKTHIHNSEVSVQAEQADFTAQNCTGNKLGERSISSSSQNGFPDCFLNCTTVVGVDADCKETGVNFVASAPNLNNGVSPKSTSALHQRYSKSAASDPQERESHYPEKNLNPTLARVKKDDPKWGNGSDPCADSFNDVGQNEDSTFSNYYAKSLELSPSQQDLKFKAMCTVYNDHKPVLQEEKNDSISLKGRLKHVLAKLLSKPSEDREAKDEDFGEVTIQDQENFTPLPLITETSQIKGSFPGMSDPVRETKVSLRRDNELQHDFKSEVVTRQKKKRKSTSHTNRKKSRTTKRATNDHENRYFFDIKTGTIVELDDPMIFSECGEDEIVLHDWDSEHPHVKVALKPAIESKKTPSHNYIFNDEMKSIVCNSKAPTGTENFQEDHGSDPQKSDRCKDTDVNVSSTGDNSKKESISLYHNKKTEKINCHREGTAQDTVEAPVYHKRETVLSRVNKEPSTSIHFLKDEYMCTDQNVTAEDIIAQNENSSWTFKPEAVLINTGNSSRKKVENDTRLLRGDEEVSSHFRETVTRFETSFSQNNTVMASPYDAAGLFSTVEMTIQPRQNDEILDGELQSFVPGRGEYNESTMAERSLPEESCEVSLKDQETTQAVCGQTTTEPPVEELINEDLNQSSLECLLEMLLQRGKVEKAFVASLEGKLLAKTSGFDLVSERDIHALSYALTSNYASMVKLPVLGSCFTCLMTDEPGTLLGRTDHCVLAAHRGKDSLVVGLADSSSPGSCMNEILELSRVLAQRGL